MAIFSLNDKKVKGLVLLVTGAFIALVLNYFFAPEIPYKLAFPVGLLFLASMWLTPWEVTLALLFSCIGDYFGASDTFEWQLAFFGVAQLFYILFFVRRYRTKVERGDKLTARAIGHLSIFSMMIIVLLVTTFTYIVPQVPEGWLRVGVGVYTILICGMFLMALLQRSSLYALGGALFVVSDLILAWNMFVEPVEYAGAMIMITYYLAQWLLFIRATPYEVAHPVRLLRF